MNALDLLKKDHQTVRELFQRLENRPEAADFSTLKNELTEHATLEEEMFYPELRDDEENEDQVMKAYEEHAEVKRTLLELTDIGIGNEGWMEKLIQLKESVEQHVEEEEQELFGIAIETFSDEELDELGMRMEQHKAEHLV
ncbi:MAG: hemerythrin domain-containing protein [Planctomycetes bacterium]|nr:hemerythrin domain-containing protein [Planctomycetota bacterium]